VEHFNRISREVRWAFILALPASCVSPGVERLIKRMSICPWLVFPYLERKLIQLMKLIIAIIRPENLSVVQAALNKHDMDLMTVSEVLDCGQEQGSIEMYRGRKVRRLVTKLRLEITVDDFFFDEVVAGIQAAGGGKVFVMGLEDASRMRSFAREPVAIGLQG
jgi:nitrogen regulatory protein P-II 1